MWPYSKLQKLPMDTTRLTESKGASVIKYNNIRTPSTVRVFQNRNSIAKNMDKKLLDKLANVPLEQPGFDALGMSAPVLVQVNPDGKWEKKAPTNMDEEKLKAIISHLVESNAVSAAHSFCSQCCAESKISGGPSNYVPVIMMPILPAEQCPFDMECEIQKMKDETKKEPTKKSQQETSNVKKSISKPKKRAYVLQRLNDFDLLSQW